jgi:hypothetical protein
MLAMLRMFRMMMAMVLSMVLAGMLMVFVSMGGMTMSQVAVVGGIVVIASLMVGVCFPMMLGSSFMVKRGMMVMVVFRHIGVSSGFLGFRLLAKTNAV